MCEAFDLDAATGTLLAFVTNYLGTRGTTERLGVIRAAKPIRRCATAVEQEAVRSDLAGRLGRKDTDGIWTEAGTALGGYTGMYPGYAPDIASRMREMGVSERTAIGTFTADDAAGHRRGATRVARRAEDTLARTDIVYFRGHQYAQYGAPGVFTEADAEQPTFDLRYIRTAGGLPNVKLMIATSCATLCAEAFSVFHGLFPNAALIGYRRGRSIKGGDAVRMALGRRINALRRPLLLDQPVDIQAILSAWESVVESRHKGETRLMPAHYNGSVLRFWDGSAWHDIDPVDPANACERHGVRADMVGP